MRARSRILPPDADLAAIRLERFTALLETVLVFSVFYLIRQWFASRGLFERAYDHPGMVGYIATHQAWIIATLLGLFLLPIFTRWVTDDWRLADFGFVRRPGRRDLQLAAYLGVVMGLWFALGFWLRPTAYEDAEQLLAIGNGWDVLFYVGYVALIASALRNEFFFRGYVQRLLTAEYGLSWGTLFTLVFFWVSLSWIGWHHVLALLVPLGIGASLLFNRRESLYGPLLFHALAFALGFGGYALLRLTPGGYAWYTAAMAAIVVWFFPRMRFPLMVLGRDLLALLKGLESQWVRNGITVLVLIGLLRLLEWTAHQDLRAHSLFTMAFIVVFFGYKLRRRAYELRDLLGP
jgi:hypothetical protein